MALWLCSCVAVWLYGYVAGAYVAMWLSFILKTFEVSEFGKPTFRNVKGFENKSSNASVFEIVEIKENKGRSP